jgi:hypothetical protein
MMIYLPSHGPRACFRAAESIVAPMIHSRDHGKRMVSSVSNTSPRQKSRRKEGPASKTETEVSDIVPGFRFCSVGSNDLTSLVYGFSRDDCGKVT